MALDREAEEVEREPSPTRAQTKHLDAVGAHGREGEKGGRSSLRLLEHAFGTQMLLGKDEWACVADVIRSSFLVVAKELKRHDGRLRMLEANDSHYRQQQQEQRLVDQQQQQRESDRWSALQTQMALFSDEHELLAHQLKQLKESDSVVHKQFGTSQAIALEMENISKRNEQRLARVKKRLESLAMQIKRVMEREDSTQARLCSAEDKLEAFATELQHLKRSSTTTASPPTPPQGNSIKELLVAQRECKEEIRRLQHALVAHDQRAMVQAREAQRRIAQLPLRNDDRAVVAKQAQLQGSKHGARDPQSPSRLGGERSAGGVPVVQSDVETQRSEPEAQSVETSTFSSHATLKERYTRAREKQQESLKQLRRQQQQ